MLELAEFLAFLALVNLQLGDLRCQICRKLEPQSPELEQQQAQLEADGQCAWRASDILRGSLFWKQFCCLMQQNC